MRLNRNKKGMELSINFLVVLILSISVFIMGIGFLKLFFTSAENTRIGLSEQTKSEIESLLNEGSRVAIPVQSLIVKKKEPAIFGLGILNSNPDKTKFFVNVVCSKYASSSSATLGSCNLGNIAIYSKKHDIKNNQRASVPIVIPIIDSTNNKIPIGKYIFNVYVCSDSVDIPTCNEASTNRYDTTQKLYVDVK